jgi:hypothetical protein
MSAATATATISTGGKITPGGTAHGSHPSSSRKVAWERRQVWEGKATKTSSGMTRSQLHKNPKTGKIVSKKKHLAAKAAKNLGAHLGKGF